MQFKNITYALALISLLTGCVTTTTGPMPAGKNTYVMSRQEGAFPSGNEPLMAEVLAEASVFCSNQDKV
ncbi:hypothetical protein [Thalassotalea piscium]|uniref:Uncharacterized protein n=1 Tax=Thalassotalea piscium TaxID=1230533 RepID=A0A7X0NKL8_9GAMM|nr:hypothetical protein [Thalassotalea piscium]MBB6545182.1 hypothetical protein [Thalassotalea piscium]